MKPSPVVTAVSGVASGVVCLAFVVLAHHVELPLSDLTKEALILGGMASMGVGAWGARKMPVKEEPKP